MREVFRVIDTLIFDFDGVIIDTETPAFKTWQEVFDSHGVRLDRALWQRIIGGGTERFDVCQHLEDTVGAKLDQDAIRGTQRQRYEYLVQSSPLLPGVLDYINDAERLGLKLAVASSSTRSWVEEHLSQRGLLRHFDCVVSREDVTNIKPDPEPYVVSMDRLDTSPERAVAIEDSLNGVTAAKRAGMFCVAVPNPMTVDMPLGAADIQLESLGDTDLSTLLATLSRDG